MKCIWCRGDIVKCRMDARGLCIRDPKSSGVEKKRTKKEKRYDHANRKL